MKKLFLFLGFILYSLGLWAQVYPAYTPTSAADEDINNVTFDVINNSTICNSLVGTQGTANEVAPEASLEGRYSNFAVSTVPVPKLLKGQTYQLSVSLGCIADGGDWLAAYFDWNNDGDFNDVQEFYLITPTASEHTSFPFVISTNIIIPKFAKEETPTRMRVVFMHNSNPPNATGTGTYTWGETEDYTIEIIKDLRDVGVEAIIRPDTLGFCGDRNQQIIARVRNYGKLDMTNTDVLMKITSPTLNYTVSKRFANPIFVGFSTDISFGTFRFPVEENIQIEFLVINPNDNIPSNDTFRETIPVFRSPTYTKTVQPVCLGDSSNLILSNFSKPAQIFWQTRDTGNQLKVRTNQNEKITYDVIRGPCIRRDTIETRINQPPSITMPRDTTLCNNFMYQFQASSNGVSYLWNDKSASTSLNVTLPSDTTRYYTLTATGANNCKRKDSFLITSVNLPPYTKLNDSPCVGSLGRIGYQLQSQLPTFFWPFNSDFTEQYTNQISVVVNSNKTYLGQIIFNGCIQTDTFVVRTKPLPTLFVDPVGQCAGLSDSLSLKAQGGIKYFWPQLNDSSPTLRVKPQVTTEYRLEGWGLNGCKNSIITKAEIYPRPNLAIYDNKNSVICSGDSVRLFVTGAKSYKWLNLSNRIDSVLLVKPSNSSTYIVEGTTDKNCKDTISSRIDVFPDFNVEVKGDTVCYGTVAALQIKGGLSYNWGVLGSSSLITFPATQNGPIVCKVRGPACEKDVLVPLLVREEVQANVEDKTFCQGETGTITASGGFTYKWLERGENNATINFVADDTVTYTIAVEDIYGCRDTISKFINVILSPDFKVNLADEYKCPTIPVTLIAIPQGGIFSGPNVNRFTFAANTLETGTYDVLYTYIDPINGCNFEYKKSVSIVKCPTNGIDDVSENKFMIYPNPAMHEVHIDTKSSDFMRFTVTLTDALGRVLNKIEVDKSTIPSDVLTIDIARLAPASYFIEIQTEEKKEVFNLIKN
ncbi:MAG: T9SS type A sorting domain-containing protein [Chitinophagales bacterium]|jgi:hypothetical protein|nr:T9SS type A sorting domain-containing protein [Chitinophagales bacterium]